MKATTILTALAAFLFSVSLTAQRGGGAERNTERHEQRSERQLPRTQRGNRGEQRRGQLQERMQHMREQLQRGGARCSPSWASCARPAARPAWWRAWATR